AFGQTVQLLAPQFRHSNQKSAAPHETSDDQSWTGLPTFTLAARISIGSGHQSAPRSSGIARIAFLPASVNRIMPVSFLPGVISTRPALSRSASRLARG